MILSKRWRCIVCNYIHEGDNPPDKCPVCGVGPEKFVLVTEETIDEKKKRELQKICFNISYGLYVICSKDKDKFNGQTANSLFQITSEPIQVALGINKGNLTHEYIKKSGVFTVSILKRDNHDLVKHFGFQSGRDIDKMRNIKTKLGEKTGVPYVSNTLAYLECEVDWERTVEVDTHTLFIARVVGAGELKDGEPMTYAYYRATRIK
jgi:flavin reductase (DIM6/NTAB) family NADH-FMN oxidoreductase RutF/rubredoxin